VVVLQRIGNAEEVMHDVEERHFVRPLHGKIWHIGTMGYNARKDAVLTTLAALEAVLAAQKHKLARGAAVDAALAAYGA